MLRQQVLMEIFEQPEAVRAALNGRVDISKGVMLGYEIGPGEIFRSMNQVVLIGCGASRHAALVAEFFIERFARLPVEVDDASEFQHHDRIVSSDTLVIAVTQHGETSETFDAMYQARNRGAFVLAVSNAAASAAACHADSTVYTRSGTESSGVSSKTFTAQLAVFYLLALFLADARGVMSREQIGVHLRQLNRVPELIERILGSAPAIEVIAARLCEYMRAVFLAPGINYPIALEGAFKLRQLSSIPAEALSSAEILDDPITIVNSQTAFVILASQDDGYSKALAKADDIKGRKGVIFAVAAERDTSIGHRADYVVRIPGIGSNLSPFLSVVPLQLFAHYSGILRNSNYESAFRHIHE